MTGLRRVEWDSVGNVEIKMVDERWTWATINNWKAEHQLSKSELGFALTSSFLILSSTLLFHSIIDLFLSSLSI